jgi:hypothetical protein
MSCSDLSPVWLDQMSAAGRYVFQPVPCVIRGMSVRLGGDGPSSWSVFLNVSRPRNTEFSRWGTLPGAYVTRRGAEHIGGKPLELMNGIVRDYSRRGNLIADPCAGLATTALAALGLGRRFVGSEIDPETHALAMARLSGGYQQELFL